MVVLMIDWPNGLAFSCRERATTSFQNANDLAREAVGCNARLGGCTRMIPLSNRQNNGCTAHHDAWVRSHGEAGAKQVRLRAVFVPASPRLRAAHGFTRWHTGRVPHGAPPLTRGAPGSRARRALRDRLPETHPKQPSNCGSVRVRSPIGSQSRQRQCSIPNSLPIAKASDCISNWLAIAAT